MNRFSGPVSEQEVEKKAVARLAAPSGE